MRYKKQNSEMCKYRKGQEMSSARFSKIVDKERIGWNKEMADWKVFNVMHQNNEWISWTTASNGVNIQYRISWNTWTE